MTTETMTIHEALSELKMLDKRITAKIHGIKYCVANRHINTRIDGKTIDEYKQNVQSEYQAVTDLIRRRAAIRNALSRSNAYTTITVCGKEYTLAEAIEFKNSGLNLQRQMLDEMGYAFNTATAAVQRENDALEDRADKYVKDLFGSKEKSNSEDIKNTRDAYVSANKFDFIDPLDISGEIERLSSLVDQFEHEIDSKISVSNALTTITISY